MRITFRPNATGRNNAYALYVPGRLAQSLKRSAMCAVFFMLLVAAAPAQIRLHDAANDDLAKKTRDAFAEFSKGDANVFETMIANTMALKEATLAQLYDMNRQSRHAAINRIPVKTWEELAADVTQAQQDLVTAYNLAQRILNANSATVTDIKGALAAAQKELERLQADKQVKEDALNGAQVNLEDLKKSLEGLRTAASLKPVKKLSDLAEFKNLKDVWTRIQEVRVWFEAAEKASNAPGLQLTILDLGVEHQKIQIERLRLKLQQANAAMQLADRITKRMAVVWGDGSTDTTTGRLTQGLFSKVYENILPCSSGPGCPSNPFVTPQTKSEQVLETMGKLAAVAKDEVGKPVKATMQLRNLIDTLGRYVALVGYHKYMLFADSIEAGADTHLFSIRESALNTRDREMLVSHGLDGLAAYYAGGLKPEEIANFFRAAQSIGLAVLAGRVK